ncbi:hypothetical protein [Nocardia aurea]|uniref:Transposase n=1 Tax=Nocardia aurea TaxID=2144174 RepID=A0ABV3G286_9NOCA
MTTNNLDNCPLDRGGVALDLLAPDLEALFDEVEQILRQSLTATATAARPRKRTSQPSDRDPRDLRSRRPDAGRATQRGPPPRRLEPKPARPCRILV